MSDSTQKLRLGALIALVVGSMVGGGIFSLPQNIAASASAGATLISLLKFAAMITPTASGSSGRARLLPV